MLFNMLDQPVVVFAHLEKVARLLYSLQWLPGARIAKVAQLCLRIGHEGFFFDVVPARVLIEVDVVVGGAAEPKSLGRAFVAGGGGADVVVIGDEDSLVEALESGDVLVVGSQQDMI